MRARFGHKIPTLRRVGPGLLAAILGFVALAAWAVASPVGSSPDEDFHLASVWCGAGERAGICEIPAGADASSVNRMVPEVLLRDAVCYAYKPAQSAACQGSLSDLALFESPRGNFDGLYPPVFYAVMSLFVSNNVDASVIAMRLFNAALFVGLISALTWLTPRGRRDTVLLPVLVTAVPLGAFLIPSINPSSWALLSASTLWISLYNYFESTGARRWVFAAFAVLAVVIGAGARADAAAYAGLAIVAVFILKARWSKSFVLTAILPVVLVIVAVLFYRSAGQSRATEVGLSDGASAAFSIGELVQNVLMVPDLWVGMLGHWGLGWLDTTMPAVVWATAFAVFAAVIFFGLARSGVRKYVALGLIFVAFWAVPTVLQLQTHAPVGAYVQPRYILPLGILLVAFALTSEGLHARRFGVAQITVLGFALSGANAVALHTNIRRYVTGQDVFGPNLSTNFEWWWPTGLTPMFTWLIGSVAFGLCLALLGVLGHRANAAADLVKPASEVEPAK